MFFVLAGWGVVFGVLVGVVVCVWGVGWGCCVLV